MPITDMVIYQGILAFNNLVEHVHGKLTYMPRYYNYTSQFNENAQACIALVIFIIWVRLNLLWISKRFVYTIEWLVFGTIKWVFVCLLLSYLTMEESK